MLTPQKENLNLLHEKIIIQLSPTDYETTYQNAIKKIAKTIQMPGFRKGNVPTSLIEKNYGESVFYEEIIKIAEKELFNYLQSNNIEILYQPLLTNTDFYQQSRGTKKDITLEFEIGLYPKVDTNFLKKIEIELFKVQLNSNSIEGEVKYYQNYYAKHEPITIFEDKDNDYLKGTIYLTDADITLPENKKPFNIFTKNIKDEVYLNKYKPLKIGDKLNFSLNDILDDIKDKYAQSLTLPVEGDKTNLSYTIEVEEMLKTIPHELNLELYKLVFGDKTTIENEIDFKTKIESELNNHYSLQAKNHAIHLLSHEIEKYYTFDIPVTFLNKWLQQQEQKNNKDKVRTFTENDFNSFYKYIKQSIFQNKIISDNQLKVTEEETRSAIKAHLLGQFGQYIVNEEQLNSFVNNSLKDEKYTREIEDNVMNSKIYDIIFENIQKKETQVTEKEFVEALKEHNEKHHPNENHHQH